MPRMLILMRHAKQSGLAVSDHERPLTDEGRDAAHRVGERLRASGPIPERAICSTALRCRETWATLAAAFAEPIEADYERDLYDASARELLDAIVGVDDGIRSLLVLAHNPGISMLGLDLAGGRENDLETMRAGFSPATTACFDVDGPWSEVSSRSARLVRFDSTP